MNDSYTYLIIGGGVAGVTAAETIRERDPHSSIAILSDESYQLYSRVLLPHYVKGDIAREKIFLRRPEDYGKNRINFIPGAKVSFLNSEKKEVGLLDHRLISYQKLLIASGGSVRKSELDEYSDFVYRLQTLDDADRLREKIHAGAIRRPLVLGGSFIALEFLSICVAYKIPVRVLFRDSHFFSRIMGSQGGDFMRRTFEFQNIHVTPKDRVEEVEEKDEFVTATTESLEMIDTDAILLGSGLERNIGFLAGSGVEVGEGVKTNEFLESNISDVYGAGDVAEFQDTILGGQRVVGNWTNSFLHGKIAGLNMTGEKMRLNTVSSYVISHFGLHLIAIGDCKEKEMAIEKVDVPKNGYERYFIENSILRGAVLVNHPEFRAHVTELISSRTPIGDFIHDLRNPSFDIRKIPVVK